MNQTNVISAVKHMHNEICVTINVIGGLSLY